MAADCAELVTDFDCQRVMADSASGGLHETGTAAPNFVPADTSFRRHHGRRHRLEQTREVFTTGTRVGIRPFDCVGPTQVNRLPEPRLFVFQSVPIGGRFRIDLIPVNQFEQLVRCIAGITVQEAARSCPGYSPVEQRIIALYGVHKRLLTCGHQAPTLDQPNPAVSETGPQ